MKSIWKGSIAFGLVNIPVRLYSATESQSLASHMLHKKDLSRIRFQRVAESTGKEVPAEEIVKGYEVEKNQYVILADEELREVAPEKSTGIDIQEFVNEAEISSLYFEKPYYLEPDKGAGKAFALLREALMKTGKVGHRSICPTQSRQPLHAKASRPRFGSKRFSIRQRNPINGGALTSFK
jgi:DNA end-binding protein Ku